MNHHKVTICRRQDKTCFETERAARAQIRRLRDAGANEAQLLQVYRCSVHRAYHIGNAA